MSVKTYFASFLKKLFVATCIASILSQSVLSATFEVMYNTDGGDSNLADGVCSDGSGCTLRAAIQQANNSGDADTIRFGMSLTIVPATAYPSISTPITIDGAYGAVTTAIDGDDTTGNDYTPFTITSTGDGTSISGLYIYDFDSAAIDIQDGASSITIGGANGGNVIGLRTDGTTADGNAGYGVSVSGNEVSIAQNTISGNGGGIQLTSTAKDVQILGNKIGTDTGGTLDKGNTNDGITVNDGASLNGANSLIEGLVIGTGGGTGYYNVIAGNDGDGIHVGSTGSTISGDIKIQGNYIGMTATGGALGNGDEGIIGESSATGVDWTVGTDGDTVADASEGNYIGSNTQRGIYIFEGDDVVVSGNKIGENASGADRGNGGAGMIIGTLSVGPNTATVGTIGTDNALGYERNVIVNNDAGGIQFNNATTANIHGNYIGISANGSTAAGNTGAAISIGASQMTTLNIGKSGSGNMNFIGNASGGGYGAIAITSLGTGAVAKIQGNSIGLASNLQLDAGNGMNGIYISAAGTVTIGSDGDDGEGNYISNNDGNGITIVDGATAVTIAGNMIGLATTGGTGTAATVAAPNGQFAAPGDKNNIKIASNSLTALTIGGTTSYQRNVVASAPEHGILISDAGSAIAFSIINNYIGFGSDGSTSRGNTGAGIYISDGGTLTITDNVIGNNLARGVDVRAGSTLAFSGNKVGTTSSGTSPAGNVGYGLRVAATAMTLLTIGSTTTTNIFAATTAATDPGLTDDGTGVRIEDVFASAVVTFFGNYVGIGSDASTTTSMNNAGRGVRVDEGILIFGGENALGNNGTGTMAGGNLVDNNDDAGLYIGTSVTSATIYGNIFGVKKVSSGFDTAAGNARSGSGEGTIYVDSTSLTSLTIGQGEDTGAGIDTQERKNLISATGSNRAGIHIYRVASGAVTNIKNNYIGTDWSGLYDLGNGAQGILLDQISLGTFNIGGTGSYDGNVISGNGDAGVKFNNSPPVTANFYGNIIGLNGSGTAALANDGQGIYQGAAIHASTVVNIGNGSGSNGRNYISGNSGAGIDHNAGTANIRGNYIGLNILGTTAIPNGSSGYGGIHGGGIYVSGGYANIGTNGDLSNDNTEGNVISGNYGQGIMIAGSAANGVVIAGNQIGTNVAGTTAIPNAAGTTSYATVFGTNAINGSGVIVADVSGMPSPDGVKIGGDIDAESNIIAGNAAYGLVLIHTSGGGGQDWTSGFIKKNYFGVQYDSTTTLVNGTTTTNEIYVDNGGVSTALAGLTIGSLTSTEKNVINNTSHVGVKTSGVLDAAFLSTATDFDNIEAMNSWTDIVCPVAYHYWEKYISSTMVDYRPLSLACAETTTTTTTTSSGGGSVGFAATSSSSSRTTAVDRDADRAVEEDRDLDEEEVVEERVVEEEVFEERVVEEVVIPSIAPTASGSFVARQRLTKAANTVTDKVTKVDRLNYEILVEPEITVELDNEESKNENEIASGEIRETVPMEKFDARTPEQILISEVLEEVVIDPLKVDQEKLARVIDIVEGNLKTEITRDLLAKKERGEAEVLEVLVRGEPRKVGPGTEIEFELDAGKALGRQKIADDREEDRLILNTSSVLAGRTSALYAISEGFSPLDERLSDKVFFGKKGDTVDQLLPSKPTITNLEGRETGKKPLLWIGGNRAGAKMKVFVVDKNGSSNPAEWQIFDGGSTELDEGFKAALEVDLSRVDFSKGKKELMLVVQDEKGVGTKTRIIANPALSIKADSIHLSKGDVVSIGDPTGGMTGPDQISPPQPGRAAFNLNDSLYATTLLASANLVEEETGQDIVQPAKRRLLTGYVEPGSTVFVTWKSVVLNSVVIADASQGYFEVEMPSELEEGEHNVMVYSYKKSRNVVSDITSLLFGTRKAEG